MSAAGPRGDRESEIEDRAPRAESGGRKAARLGEGYLASLRINL